ncbi:MAG: hypothetical protein A3H27_00795 [Acidobacteria bacterium RIFCSPLOWO2_02_FULL_59_13]|nr:MAG: hypothetical protein A3H27_00795 [Acidobacteria bacterium RIFCSPLOWO2_02_FULL_59_13]
MGPFQGVNPGNGLVGAQADALIKPHDCCFLRAFGLQMRNHLTRLFLETVRACRVVLEEPHVQVVVVQFGGQQGVVPLYGTIERLPEDSRTLPDTCCQRDGPFCSHQAQPVSIGFVEQNLGFHRVQHRTNERKDSRSARPCRLQFLFGERLMFLRQVTEDVAPLVQLASLNQRRVSRPFLHRYRECASVVQHIEPPLLEIDAAP